MKSTANNTQVGGTHYAGAVQHWDYTAANFGIGYFQGQITKYVCRWRKKNGLQDLMKAAHFLQKLQEVLRERDMREVGLRGFVLRLLRRVYAEVWRGNVTAEMLDMQSAELLICHCVERGDINSLRRAELTIALLMRHVADVRPQAGADATRSYVNQDPGRIE